jgi:hypothetical protein
MENYGEVGVEDYLRLMSEYLAGKIDADKYIKGYFAFNKYRVNLPNEAAEEIILRAHGDADDYEPDPTLRQSNSQWIGEPELRERVAKSFHKLEALESKS